MKTEDWLKKHSQFVTKMKSELKGMEGRMESRKKEVWEISKGIGAGIFKSKSTSEEFRKRKFLDFLDRLSRVHADIRESFERLVGSLKESKSLWEADPKEFDRDLRLDEFAKWFRERSELDNLSIDVGLPLFELVGYIGGIQDLIRGWISEEREFTELRDEFLKDAEKKFEKMEKGPTGIEVA